MKNNLNLRLLSLLLAVPFLCGCLQLGGKTSYYTNPPEIENRLGSLEQRMGNLERICGVAQPYSEGTATSQNRQMYSDDGQSGYLR